MKPVRSGLTALTFVQAHHLHVFPHRRDPFGLPLTRSQTGRAAEGRPCEGRRPGAAGDPGNSAGGRVMIPMPPGRLLVVVGLLALPIALRAQSGAASLEVDYTVPSGYVAKPEGGVVWLSPQTMGPVSPPCVYGLAPPRSATGSLEADAEAALAETVAGGRMRRTNDYRIARRGVAAAGWPYFLSGGNFQGQTAGGEALYLAVMAMVFPAPANRVNVVFGVGKLSEGLFN